MGYGETGKVRETFRGGVIVLKMVVVKRVGVLGANWESRWIRYSTSAMKMVRRGV